MDKNMVRQYIEENYQYFKYYLLGRFKTLKEYEVEDIVQTTLVKILFRGENTLNVQHLSAYLYTALSNGAIDYFKKNSREIGELSRSIPSKSSVESEILNHELRDQILRAIDGLDEKTKYVFVETEIKGRSYEALSEETGEKIGTLLSRKSRGKVKLQEILKDYYGR